MNITIFTIGSRGDTQPYVALGRGLQQAGHTVRLATYGFYESFLAEYGLEIAPLSGDPREVMASPAGQQWLQSGQNPVQFVRAFIDLTKPRLELMFAEGVDACRGADLIIYSDLGFVGYHAAEYLGVPALQARLQPFGPTRDFPSVGVPPWMQFGGWSNYLSHVMTDQIMWQPFRRLTNRWRTEKLGLEPEPFFGPFADLNRTKQPVLYGFSPQVLPKPDDWEAWRHVVGYWILPPAPDWSPPAELVQFLESGPPPVYIGFGSMMDRDPAELTRLITTAVSQAKVRAVLHAGWGNLIPEEQSDDLFVVESVPHEWLFPRMAAIVHHGGAGTTAAGLRSGQPSVAVPFFADQYFWSRRIRALGVGPEPISRAKLTVEGLSGLLKTAVSDQLMAQQAFVLGERLRAEDGVKTAVLLIERLMESRRPGPARLFLKA